VPWWVWIALATFAVVVAAGVIFAVAAFMRLKRLQAVGEAIAARADAVAAESEELERRLAHASERAGEVERHLDRLRASVERLSVLSWGLGDARKSVMRLRGAYLRK
jgi:hypothetical protein